MTLIFRRTAQVSLCVSTSPNRALCFYTLLDATPLVGLICNECVAQFLYGKKKEEDVSGTYRQSIVDNYTKKKKKKKSDVNSKGPLLQERERKEDSRDFRIEAIVRLWYRGETE